MSQPLPKDCYLLAKLDTEFRFTYINQLYENFFKNSRKKLKNKTLVDVKSPIQPAAIYQQIIKGVTTKGFASGLAAYSHSDGKQYWGFVDMTRRFGASASSGMIGYEYVAYPASQACIDFFSPIYSEMLKIEQEHPGEAGVNEASTYLDQRIQESGKTYDELAHSLQNS